MTAPSMIAPVAASGVMPMRRAANGVRSRRAKAARRVIAASPRPRLGRAVARAVGVRRGRARTQAATAAAAIVAAAAVGAAVAAGVPAPRRVDPRLSTLV